jgi:hypothetical protein
VELSFSFLEQERKTPEALAAALRGLPAQEARAFLGWVGMHPRNLRKALLIRAGGGPAVLSAALAPFQGADFAALDAAFLAAAGRSTGSAALKAKAAEAPRKFWIERVKGASKTSDVAAELLWALAFGRPGLLCQVGAADQSQADELRKVVLDLVRWNPWLGELVEVQKAVIVGKQTGSRCEILTADEAGSHGGRPDVLVVDEIVHVIRREFVENLMDNASKMPRGLVVVCTNAGVLETWQWRWRETARTSGRWHFSQVTTPAPWIDPAELAEAEKRNPPSRFARLWRGIWVTGEGDGLPADLVEAALTQAGPLGAPEKGWLYVAGLDLGVRKDASALVVVGVHVGYSEEIPQERPPLPRHLRVLIEAGEVEAPAGPAPEYEEVEGTGRVRLAAVRVWRAPPGRRVNLSAVEAAVAELHGRFDLAAVALDPWQAELMAQRLAGKGLAVDLVPFSGPILRGMAQAVWDAFGERSVDLYPDPDLKRDLAGVRLVEKSYGSRLVFGHDEGGHGDTGTAFTLALHAGRNCRGGAPGRVRGELLCWP